MIFAGLQGTGVFNMLLYFFHLKKGEFSLEARQPEAEIHCIWIW